MGRDFYLVEYILSLRRIEKLIVGRRTIEAFCRSELERYCDIHGLEMADEIRFDWDGGKCCAWTHAMHAPTEEPVG